MSIIADAYEAAVSLIDERLSSRETWTLDRLLEECEVPVRSRPSAACILRLFSRWTEIDPGRLRPTDKLAAVFQTDPADVSRRLGQRDLSALRAARFVEAFGYELLEAAERCTSRRGWRRQMSSLSAPPRNESQWLDAIMAMTFAEYINFFAAAAED